MASNDAMIRLTVRIPKDLYEEMHEVTRAAHLNHNGFIVEAIRESLFIEKRVMTYREKLQRKA